MSTGYMRWGHWAAVSTVNCDADADEADAAGVSAKLAASGNDSESTGAEASQWPWDDGAEDDAIEQGTQEITDAGSHPLET